MGAEQSAVLGGAADGDCCSCSRQGSKSTEEEGRDRAASDTPRAASGEWRSSEAGGPSKERRSGRVPDSGQQNSARPQSLASDTPRAAPARIDAPYSGPQTSVRPQSLTQAPIEASPEQPPSAILPSSEKVRSGSAEADQQPPGAPGKHISKPPSLVPAAPQEATGTVDVEGGTRGSQPASRSSEAPRERPSSSTRAGAQVKRRGVHSARSAPSNETSIRERVRDYLVEKDSKANPPLTKVLVAIKLKLKGARHLPQMGTALL